jgi:glycosyltransferase involved in cell wall biosynthesis
VKVTHFSGTDKGEGGAGRAAYGIHKGLLRLGIQSTLWVSTQERNEPEIRQLRHSNFPLAGRLRQVKQAIDRKLLSWVDESYDALSSGLFGYDPVPAVRSDKPDIVQLHWFGNSIIKVSRLSRIQVPIVWRLADMWAFCGVEHYTTDGVRFVDRYSKSNRPANLQGLDVSRWAWENKRRAYSRIRSLTIVAPSQWLADCAKQSALFRDRNVVVIKTGCNTMTFHPREKDACREVLEIPKNKFIVLAGAGELRAPRKGPNLLVEAVNKLSNLMPAGAFQLVLFGNGGDDIKQKLTCNTHCFGLVTSDLFLSILYAAADVFVAPSRQENLANTVLEAMACGRPCVAFNVGGMPDAIDHCWNGYLAKPYDTDDLAAGILWGLTQTTQAHRESARRKIETFFNQELQASQYRALYEKLLRK